MKFHGVMKQIMLEALSNRVFSACDKNLLTETRIHPIPSFDQKGGKVYVKREDESSFGISGCKKRKYASLIPWLIQQDIKVVGLIGGARSNHIAGLLQLLRENRIDAHLFLKQTHHHSLQGNQLLLHLLTDPSDISWIAPQDWYEVEKNVPNLPIFKKIDYLIPEGGTCAPAMPGACSLMWDIVRNEQELQIQFDHIFIDAGTGMMAGALVLAHHWLAHPAQLHVVLTAGTESYFKDQLEQYHQWTQDWHDHSFSSPTLPNLYFPATARSFGSVNAQVIAEVRRLAKEEGVLTDPIYTAKLFLTARQEINTQQMQGNILIIHSGGGMGLMGFGERF